MSGSDELKPKPADSQKPDKFKELVEMPGLIATMNGPSMWRSKERGDDGQYTYFEVSESEPVKLFKSAEDGSTPASMLKLGSDAEQAALEGLRPVPRKH